MDLDELANRHFDETRGEGLFEAPFVLELIERFDEPEQVVSTVATAAWQILRSEDGFNLAVEAMRVSDPKALSHGIVVPYSTARFGLVMVDPNLEQGDVRTQSLRLYTSYPSGKTGWNKWRSLTASQIGRGNAPLLNALAEYGPSFATDIAHQVQFEVMVVPEPPLELTSVPVPAIPAQLPSSDSDISLGDASQTGVATIGVLGVVDGAEGVTVPCHMFMRCDVTPVPGVTTVRIGSKVGVVKSVDPISDSCFVEVPTDSPVPARPTHGPLRHVTPRQNEIGSFWGHVSGECQTVVTGWSLDLLHVAPWNQLKVFTRPSTRGGDSGAALLDSSGHVLGFSHYRTGFGAHVEFSAWVWADSVYTIHGLS